MDVVHTKRVRGTCVCVSNLSSTGYNLTCTIFKSLRITALLGRVPRAVHHEKENKLGLDRPLPGRAFKAAGSSRYPSSLAGVVLVLGVSGKEEANRPKRKRSCCQSPRAEDHELSAVTT